MYLIDTNVISEARKGNQTNKGVQRFFAQAIHEKAEVFLSVVTIGELRRGIESIRYRGDEQQAQLLEHWLSSVLEEYSDSILDIDSEIAEIWGRLRAPHPQNALDKLIAATALIHDLTVVTRNNKDFYQSRVRVLNPFDPE